MTTQNTTENSDKAKQKTVWKESKELLYALLDDVLTISLDRAPARILGTLVTWQEVSDIWRRRENKKPNKNSDIWTKLGLNVRCTRTDRKIWEGGKNPGALSVCVLCAAAAAAA